MLVTAVPADGTQPDLRRFLFFVCLPSSISHLSTPRLLSVFLYFPAYFSFLAPPPSQFIVPLLYQFSIPCHLFKGIHNKPSSLLQPGLTARRAKRTKCGWRKGERCRKSSSSRADECGWQLNIRRSVKYTSALRYQKSGL